MSAEVFGLTQQILMLISAYINTGVCGKLHLWETKHFLSKTVTSLSLSFERLEYNDTCKLNQLNTKTNNVI